MTNLRVLFLSLYDPCEVSSISNHLRYLSKALNDIGCEVHILALGSEAENRDINGIQLHYVEPHFFRSFGKGFMFSLSSIGVTNKISKNYGIDIVHGQSPSSFGYALLSRARCPFVVTFHGTSFGEISSHSTVSIRNINFGLIRAAMFVQPSTAFLTIIEYKYADKLVAVSKAVALEAAMFYRLPEDKIVVIHNGVCLPRVSNVEIEDQNASQVILFVGRLIWRKGVKYLIDAMPKILAEYVDTKLLVVGNGEQRPFLEKRAEKLGIENSVQFLGNVSSENLYSLYNEADVYVQPSLYEPCGLAVLEAMSMGKSTVATRVGGIPELVTNGVEGLLVQPRNSLQLARAIINVFSDPSCRRRFGSNARKKVEREFTWEAIAKKTFEFYKNLLNDT
jgi:glycosyltransferase involved in cell wall biosynthesis